MNVNKVLVVKYWGQPWFLCLCWSNKFLQPSWFFYEPWSTSTRPCILRSSNYDILCVASKLHSIWQGMSLKTCDICAYIWEYGNETTLGVHFDRLHCPWFSLQTAFSENSLCTLEFTILVKMLQSLDTIQPMWFFWCFVLVHAFNCFASLVSSGV